MLLREQRRLYKKQPMSIDIATLINPIPNIMGNLLNNYKKCLFLIKSCERFQDCIPKIEVWN